MHSSSTIHMERDRPKRASLVKMRFLIAVMATLCPVVCYIGRQNLPLAIVSMVQDDEAPPLVGPEASTLRPPNPLPDSVLGDDLGLLHSLTAAGPGQQQSNSTTSGTGAGIMSMNVSPIKRSTRAAVTSGESQLGACPAPTTVDEFGKVTTEAKTRTYGPKYAWDQEDRARLLGAFFWTYVIFQIPGARLAERIGAKWILAAASSGTCLLSFLSPWAASQHVYLFWFVRLLMGVFQAAIYPSCYVLYARWLPPVERSQALPILGVGAFVGAIVVSSLTGYFSEQPAFGWEWAFYVPGILCALWSIIWIWFASNEPREHKFISIEEIQHIETSMELGPPGQPAPGGVAKRDISWLKLVSSRAIWVMMIAFFASNWAFSNVLLLVPSYLNDILRVSPMENGVINSVIYILFCLVSPLVGTGSTMMVETRAFGLSRLKIRKLFQCTALFGLATCFLAITWLGCQRTLVIGVLFTQIVFFSLVNGGEVQLPSELSPDFSGTIYAIGNCVGSSTGFIVPQVYSLIVTDKSNRLLWDWYFYLAAAITALGGLVFLLLGENKMQDFSKDLGESQLDFGQIGLTSTMKSIQPQLGNISLGAPEGRHKRSPGSVRVMPPEPLDRNVTGKRQ